MTRLEIFQVMRSIVLRVTGVPECILADPNAPAPTGVYAAIEPKINPRQRGQANIVHVTGAAIDTVDITINRQLLVDCSINFYRGDAVDYAEKIHDANKYPSVSKELYEAGLGWMGTQPINNLTALQNDKWEQRREITVNLAYVPTETMVENVNSIEQVPYEITDGGDNDRILAEGTVN